MCVSEGYTRAKQTMYRVTRPPRAILFLADDESEKRGLPNLELQLTQTVGKWRLPVSLQGQRHLSPFFPEEAHLFAGLDGFKLSTAVSREKSVLHIHFLPDCRSRWHFH